jgi:O-antigen/teichoic acid export membrane protein
VNSVTDDLQDLTPASPHPEVANSQKNLSARVLQNAAAAITGRGLAIVFSTGAAILLARFLGVEKLGQYGAIYAYIGLFSWLATFGFEPVLLRELSKDRNNASSLVHTTVVLSALFSVITIGFSILLARWFGYSGFLWWLLVLASLEFVLTPLRLPAVIFQVDMRQWYPATINVVRQGLWFGIIGVFWVIKAPLLYVVLARVFTALVESLMMWAWSRRFLLGDKQFLLDRARTLLTHSFPIAFTVLLGTIYLRIDQVMLHNMTTDSVLGQYVAAVKVSELLELLPAGLMFSIAPILSVSFAEPQRFRSHIDRAFRYLMVLAGGLCVTMAVGARMIIWILYGKQFLPAASLLVVLIWAEIAIFFAAVVINALIASNQQGFLPLPTLVGAAANVALNLVLIPRYAAMGAAWATLVSYTMAWMVSLLFISKTRSLAWQGLRFALPIVGVALFSVACATRLPSNEIVRVPAALAMFVAGLWVTRSIRGSDINDGLAALKGSFAKHS